MKQRSGAPGTLRAASGNARALNSQTCHCGNEECRGVIGGKGRKSAAKTPTKAQKLKDEATEQLLTAADKNKDGMIQREEWAAFVMGGQLTEESRKVAQLGMYVNPWSILGDECDSIASGSDSDEE